MDKQKIIFSNRFEKEKFEDYKTDLGTGNAITPDFSEADDFLKFIQKNRRSVPSKERIADKDKFIKTVYELSNSFEIDADLIEFAEGYIANIYVDYACYTGYIKKLLAIQLIQIGLHSKLPAHGVYKRNFHAGQLDIRRNQVYTLVMV